MQFAYDHSFAEISIPAVSSRYQSFVLSKGAPTREVWYYEHRLPAGQKSYSKTKTIRVEEFQPIKAWWSHRAESELCWKVHINTIKDRGYDLDIKNPHRQEETHEYTSREIIGLLEQSLAKSHALLEKLNAKIGQ